MSDTSFAGFVNYWGQYMKDNPQQRRGQAAYNAAWFYNDDTRRVADNVDGSLSDPFFRDERLDAFLLQVAEALDRAKEASDV